ncbi:hypothetical protein CBR_g54572 [Chara braunii]|uniref:Uncharacterized protein n=1 Tax=Chara braunii TaxID=69332 RepID=A0A388MCE7_CHABU|nr:hypothetical protein CBR_g54572 [Chara braunii]|eukprot:GBG92175.1 hypothetical protein CBR_g54572 [Chara braunii]
MDGLNASTAAVGETIGIGTKDMVEAMAGADVTLAQQTRTNAQEGGMETECGVGATLDVGTEEMVMGDDDELGRGCNSHSTTVPGKEVANKQDVGTSHSRLLEHWQFLVVLARVSICNTRVKDKTTLVGHATACWAKIRSEDRHVVMVGYDTYPNKEMWSITGFMDAGDARTDTPNNCLDAIRRRHGSASLFGWLPVVCPMTYDCGADINMIMRNPLGVSFHVTYTDGLLRYIQYMPEEDSQTMCNDWKRRSGHNKGTHSSSEAESPDGDKDVERLDKENLNDAGCGDVEQRMGDAKPSARLQQGMGGAEPSARLEQGMGGIEPSARLEQGMGGVEPFARLEQGMGGVEPSARLKERMGGAKPSARSDDMMREKKKQQKCGVSKSKGKTPAVGDTTVPTKQKVGVAKRRRRPWQATLAEIRHLQHTVHLC